jgi:fatty-acid desaturase
MNAYFYLIFLPLHIFAVLSLFYTNYLSLQIIFIFWILLSGLGVGVTLHRLLGHRAFETYEWLKTSLSLLSCFCVQGSPLFWVNVHRGYHHKYADQELDLHSPIKGKNWSYWLWACRVDPTILSYKSVPDLLRSKFQLLLSRQYYLIVWIGWILALIISPKLFFSLVIAQTITLHLEFCVNLFCHTNLFPFGYRNFNTPDKSRNFWLFGVTCWGIGFHNNHHARPRECSFAYSNYEFDPTTLLVWILKRRSLNWFNRQ